jgi:hypothetical protein
VELADGAVDAVSEAEVVCVEDEAGGHADWMSWVGWWSRGIPGY